LYNHSIWKNLVYSTFNFQYSTMLNRFITENKWDLFFANSCDKKPTLNASDIPGAVTGMVPLQFKNINLVTLADFPDPNDAKGNVCDGLIEKGKTYGFYTHSTGQHPAAVYGAAQVIELDKDGNWVRLKFRRIAVQKPQRFQQWQSGAFAGLPGWKFTNEQPFFIHDPYKRRSFEFISFKSNNGADQLVMSSSLYEKDCGLFNFGEISNLDSLTTHDLENKKGEFLKAVEISAGDVIGVYSENYHYKVIMVFKIDEHNIGKSTLVSTKYLYQAKTKFNTPSD